ncbi:MAG: leucine-rich repeat domain-containing protein, partial [Ureaplasma sp.]|nr:leucine-rich repeat domain-containing protein [Ureaplasma sp.]
ASDVSTNNSTLKTLVGNTLTYTNQETNNTTQLGNTLITSISLNSSNQLQIALNNVYNKYIFSPDNTNISFSNNVITISNLTYFESINITGLSDVISYVQSFITSNTYTPNELTSYLNSNLSTFKTNIASRMYYTSNITSSSTQFSSSQISNITLDTSNRLVISLNSSNKKYTIQSTTNASLSNTTITLSGFSFYTSIEFSKLSTIKNDIQDIITNNTYTSADFNDYVTDNKTELRNIFINGLGKKVTGPGTWSDSYVGNFSFDGTNLSITVTLPTTYKYSVDETTDVSLNNGTFTFKNFAWYTPTKRSYFNWNGSTITGLSSDGANLTSINIPGDCTGLGYYAFRGNNNITSVTIPASVTSVANAVFENCPNLTSVTLKPGFNAIAPYMFNNCTKLSSVSFPDSITSIGEWAFQNNDSISSISIPSAVRSIGNYAFSSCQNLVRVDIYSTYINIGEGGFGYDPNLSSMYFHGLTSTSNIKLNLQAFYNSWSCSFYFKNDDLKKYVQDWGLTNFSGKVYTF